MDAYTPYGYLDNPWHCARLNTSGVIRCRPAIGFAWHYPGLGGPYIHRQVYSAGLRLAIHSRYGLLLTPSDFEQARISLVSRIHSKNIISFDFELDGVLCSTAFFLAGEHALCCIARLSNISSSPARLPLSVVAEYEREIGASEVWDCGLIARPLSDLAGVSLLAYAEGEAFACIADAAPAARGVARATSDLLSALVEPVDRPSAAVSPPAKGPAAVCGGMRFDIHLSPGQQVEHLVVLSRGVSDEVAITNGREALSSARDRYRQHAVADEQFRLRSPALSGDWPAHWRRGVVYDLESVRAMVRPPRGIYGHPWDAMQAQSPRTVLAEATLDSLLLSYSSPELAKQVILGLFADARAPNVPCSREDGSFNMIAEDGGACGTAPEWCFPIYCVDIIHLRCGDPVWQRRIYPHLSRYLAWWLRHRTDREGWLHYNCSWESGQDESPRFGHQISGASSIAHIRPVDLHASVSQAASILSRWSGDLGRDGAAKRWLRVAERYRSKTLSLWRDGWFHDYDARASAFVSFRDVMHLAPLLGGLSNADQLTAIRPAFAALPPHGVFPALDWPPVVFTAVEAASAAGWRDLAGDIAYRVVDRVYRAYDSRSPAPNEPLPGIAAERWATTGSWGCEAYGWGAMSVLLALRHIVGWHERAGGGIDLCPSLPAAWLAPGRHLAVGPLHHRGIRAHLVYRCRAARDLEIELELQGEPGPVRVFGHAGAQVASSADGKLAWPARNGQLFLIDFPLA